MITLLIIIVILFILVHTNGSSSVPERMQDFNRKPRRRATKRLSNELPSNIEKKGVVYIKKDTGKIIKMKSITWEEFISKYKEEL